MLGAQPPVPVSSFVGRRRELTALTSLVDHHRLVTLTGPGGAGKTRLAVHWLGSAAREVVAFVDLGPLQDPALLAATVARACGLRDEPGVDLVEQLCQQLAGSSALLVLDTCEHLRGAVAGFADRILCRCPMLRVLVTSRVALGMPGEAVLPVGGLGRDAVSLFLDRARLAQPSADGGDAECARAICALTDGLPLGIELAAAHARALSLPDILAGMSNRLGFLAVPAPWRSPRHSSLAASIRWSYELVDEQARQLQRALSVLPGPFTLDAAQGILGGPATTALEVLVDHSLIQFDAADGRYLLLDTIREFAYIELCARGDRETTERRLLDWALGLAEAARSGLDRAADTALHRILRDSDGLRAALETALRSGRGLDTAARIVTALTFFWSLRGHCAEGRVWAARVMAAFDEPPCELLWASAFLAGYAGDLTVSGELARLAAETSRQAGDQRTRCRALIVAGMNEMFGQPGAAIPVLTEGAEVADRAGDRWARVEALQMLAYAHLMRSDHRQALWHLDAALPALEELGHQQLRAWDAAIRAEAASLVGQFGAAEDLARRAVALASEVGEPVSAATAMRSLTAALCQLGRVDECAAILAEMAPFFAGHPGLGSREMAGISAATAAVWRHADMAVAEARAAETAAESSGVASLVGEARSLLAVAQLVSGDPEQASVTASRAIAQAESIDAVASVCTARLVWCAAQRALGTAGSPEAASAAHRALADASGNGLLPLVADALDVVAGLDVDQARYAMAARLHAAAERLRAGLGCAPSPLATMLRGADECAIARRLSATEVASAREQGGRLNATSAAGYAARSRGRRCRPRSGWASLTPTECDVVALTTAGLSNRDIGAQLLISEGTVRTHLRSVFAKVGVRSRAELAAEAARRVG
jgi:predicted ATPase/DNA-binding CsgD family transcriptional regulator